MCWKKFRLEVNRSTTILCVHGNEGKYGIAKQYGQQRACKIVCKRVGITSISKNCLNKYIFTKQNKITNCLKYLLFAIKILPIVILIINSCNILYHVKCILEFHLLQGEFMGQETKNQGYQVLHRSQGLPG